MVVHSRINRDARVRRAASALLDSGYPLQLICLENVAEPDIPSEVSSARLDFISSSRSMFLVKAFVRGLSGAPQIVHCHDLNVLPVCWLISALRRAPLIYDSHEIFTEKVGLRFKRLWRSLERFLIHRSNVVITTTEMRAEILKETYELRELPAVVHNFPAAWTGKNQNIREAAGLSSDTFVALYQGGVQAHRGLEQLVDASQYLKGTDSCIVIQGDGPLSSRIREAAERCAGRDHIRILPGGTHDYLRSFTASADAGLQVLQPGSLNHTTTLSNKLFEYPQAGLPVVASDFPMIRRFIEKYGCGVLVDPTNPEQIGKAIRRLLERPNELREFRQKAAEAASDLNWEKEQSVLLGLFERIRDNSLDKAV
jgi:glycosyltransferase involved in cell wall biosynthesis